MRVTKRPNHYRETVSRYESFRKPRSRRQCLRDRSSEKSSSSSSFPGTACSSAAHAPRSINLQRSEQNGRCGLCGPHSTGAPQVGHLTTVVLMADLLVASGKNHAGARLRPRATPDRDRSPAHRPRAATAPRGWLELSEWRESVPPMPDRGAWRAAVATTRERRPPAPDQPGDIDPPRSTAAIPEWRTATAHATNARQFPGESADAA